MSLRNRIVTYLVWLLASFPLYAQFDFTGSQGDVVIGVTADLGMPVNRVGLIFGANYRSGFFQANHRTNIQFGLTGLGPKGKYVEAQMSFGVVAAFGPQDDDRVSHFLHPLSNQTGQRNSLGYALNFFLDNKKTTQNTGAIGLQFSGIEIIFDNDILAFGGRDKFRTGAVQIGYSRDKYRGLIELITWTGNTQVHESKRIRESNYPAKHGYMDLSKAVLGNYSHGVLALNFQYAHTLAIVPGIRIGIDAEQIRNLFQNKLIHDMPFVPAKWMTVQNPHIPMIDINGDPYLYLEGQKIKKPKAVFQLNFNGTYY